jgi:hypothetical protein
MRTLIWTISKGKLVVNALLYVVSVTMTFIFENSAIKKSDQFFISLSTTHTPSLNISLMSKKQVYDSQELV